MRPAEDIIKRPYITERAMPRLQTASTPLLWTQRLQKLNKTSS